MKNVIKPDDWASIKECVFFDFLKDSHFVELKNQELRKGMYEELNSVEKYIGKYYSHYWIRTQVLGMSEAQIKEMEGQIRTERNLGLYAPDNASFGLQ